MRFSTTFVKLALFAAPVFAAPAALKTVIKYDGDVKSNSYIVVLKPDVSTSGHIQSLNLSSGSVITNEWSTAVNGFAGRYLPSLTVAILSFDT